MIDYKKIYEERLKRAKELKKLGACDMIECIERIFPELKESDDERIRKEIVLCVESYGPKIANPKLYGDMIAWLEKQGEQKPIKSIQMGKRYKCVASPRYSCFRIGDIYKPEDEYLCGLMNFCSDCFEPAEDRVEQKPDEWSEDDEMRFKNLCWLIDRSGEGWATKNGYKDWLKSLKDRVQPQPKQEWSEEDEKILKDIITDVKFEGYNNDMQANSYKKINWLKSLRPQKHWKPSEEQINALQVFLGHGCAAPDKEASIAEKVVDGLYNDLKKLTE